MKAMEAAEKEENLQDGRGGEAPLLDILEKKREERQHASKTSKVEDKKKARLTISLKGKDPGGN